MRDGVEIPALAEYVVDTTMNTSVGRNGIRIGTVEHLLAASAAAASTTRASRWKGRRSPIMDGSSEPFRTAREASRNPRDAAVAPVSAGAQGP